jgi:hypothetical protein
VSSAPVKCLTVENILTDILEPSLSPEVLEGRTTRRADWENDVERAEKAWRDCFRPFRDARDVLGQPPINDHLRVFLGTAIADGLTASCFFRAA